MFQSNNKVDGSFIATILETASVVVLYYGWISITEGAFTRSVRTSYAVLILDSLLQRTGTTVKTTTGTHSIHSLLLLSFVFRRDTLCVFYFFVMFSSHSAILRTPLLHTFVLLLPLLRPHSRPFGEIILPTLYTFGHTCTGGLWSVAREDACKMSILLFQAHHAAATRSSSSSWFSAVMVIHTKVFSPSFSRVLGLQ